MSLRILSSAILLAPLVIAVVLVVSLGVDAPPSWTYAVGPVLAAVGFGLATVAGYRVTAAEAGLEPQRAARRSETDFRLTHMLRIAMTEAPMLLTMVVCFAVEPTSSLAFLVGLPFVLASMWWHVWPGDALISRVQAALERTGAPSYLREGLQKPMSIESSLPHL
ncbi:hypothetical protein VV02_11115 [Luteipulveratus mongoliensis]|uniref:Uncharacterized protein n=2 Tax=Luteipulveratus mongoliensis TaxID=571913 RepID=A0A0K1JI80_9MICO|nr:hypothetical protein VV02_11115 [Luteipulveratus mongoliensis]